MNLKRGIIFGLIFWVIVFVIISILMFIPWIKDSSVRINIIWYILEIPLVLLLAKWYFKQRKPSLKEGVMIGITALIVGTILDVVITIPVFLKGNYTQFYGDWMLYIGYVEMLVLTTISGWEFDGPVAKTEELDS